MNLTVTPAENQSGGPVTITVSAEDPTAEKTIKQFTVTVSPVNDAPLAQDDQGITMDEDGVIEIDVLANDSDPADGDTLSISDAGAPEHGTTMIVLGKVRYTPDADYAGADSFTYEISDGNGGTATALVTIDIANINDAPSAADDAASTQEDYAVIIPVLDNDTDVDTNYDPAELIHILSATNGAHGTTALTEGGIRYTPESNFNGTDTFTYTISDEGGLTSEASVTVTIAPEADDPWFSGLLAEYDIDEDAQGFEISFTVYDVETPQDSLMVQAASLDEALLEQSGIELVGLGDADPAVSLLLTPKADQHGDVDITLTLGDGFNTVEQTITIHIANVNDAPRAKDDTVKYVEDAAYVDILVSMLLQNDVDIEGDALIYGGIETLTSVGTIEQLNETTLRYTPVANYDGTDSFTYSVGDGLASSSATCTLEAIGVNDAPVVVVANGTYSTNEDTL
ncbi:MAG: tandem-95 repeat protein, partial [Eubacteriales bacterium]